MKPVLVIGGTRGTGKMIVESLIERGHSVRVIARRPEIARRALASSVEIAFGDLTRPPTLSEAVRNVAHIIFTAGVHSGRIASEVLVRRTDHDGVLYTLEAAERQAFAGRFVYLNSIGVTVPSASATLLNLMKRNTLVWRQRVEHAIRRSSLDYTIIRVGFLSNRPGGQREVRVTQEPLPLGPAYRIARADVADGFVEALFDPHTSSTTFDLVWGKGARRLSWKAHFQRLAKDA